MHHIVDPGSGRPADVVWRTVSVHAGSCVDANTAATACFVKGQAAPDWLSLQQLAGRLVRPDGTVLLVAGWPEEVRAA
jgi:thiamine biosynthesis lipoprotein